MNTQVAAQQPPTTAKVVLYTSHGQLDIQLWANQTPLASRNFIQHCINGYYTNTIFHRLIPGFMIQGGDPAGTGLGGQSIYGAPFKDQFHQRLKFTRRGIIAMANVGKNTNQSQFFITFGPCQHLNKKHTIFGKVVNDTIYNLMSMQSLDTANQDRPLDPPVIRKIKVSLNPFTDLKTSTQTNEEKQNWQQQAQNLEEQNKKRILQFENQKNKKKQDLKKLKNKNKLTFDDQEQQAIHNQNNTSSRIKSSHDVLYKKDASLSNKISITKQDLQKKRKQKEIQQKKAEELRNALSLKQNQQKDEQNLNLNQIISKQISKKRAGFERGGNEHKNLQGQQILNYQKRFNQVTHKFDIIFKDQLDRQKQQRQKAEQMQKKAKQQQQISDQKLRQVRQEQLQEYSMLKADELNFKKAKQGSLKQRRKQIIQEEKKLLSNLEKHRYEYLKKQKQQKHEGQLFKKLMGFSTRLKSGTKQQTGQLQNKQELVEQNPHLKQNKQKIDWMCHKLKFHIDSSNAYSLEEKTAKLNRMNEDGGLKMQIQYNNDEQQSQQDIQKLLQKQS